MLKAAIRTLDEVEEGQRELYPRCSCSMSRERSAGATRTSTA
jgi:hypothetical protein